MEKKMIELYIILYVMISIATAALMCADEYNEIIDLIIGGLFGLLWFITLPILIIGKLGSLLKDIIKIFIKFVDD